MPHKKRKLTPEQIRDLRREYEALEFYNDDAEDTLQKLLERWDISKPTLYRYRETWLADDERLRMEKERQQAGERDTEKALAYLSTELVTVKLENERLRRKLAELQADSGD